MVIYQEKKNNYWFGSWTDGAFRYDGKTIIHYTTKDSLPHNRIDDIKEDKSGNIYFNTSGGISKFDGQKFNTLPVVESNEWELQPDDLWFKCAQDSGLVYRYDGKVLHRLTFPKTKAGDEHFARLPRSKYPNAKYSPYDVYIIYNDSKGNVWFGTATLGVCRYDGKSFTWISEKELEFDEETAFGIRSIIEDKNGKYWFSNTLHRFDVAQDGNYNKEKGIDSLDGKNNFDMIAIMSMAKDNDDLWMVTYNQGVMRYNGKQVTHYPVKYNGKDITLFSIYKDNNGELWLGTHENGAYKFNGTTFEKFTP